MVQVFKNAVKKIVIRSNIYRIIQNVSYPPSFYLRILSYHKVTKKYDPFFPSVTLEQFQRQLIFLKKNYQLLSLSGALKKRTSLDEVARPIVTITFDDGFESVFKYFYPLLKKYKIPFTIFLTSGFIDTSDTLWTDKLAGIIKKTSHKYLQINDITYSLKGKSQKLRSLQLIKQKLKRLKKEDLIGTMYNLQNELEVESVPLEHPFLSWEQIRYMQQDLLEVGSHTVTHPILSMISPIDQEFEIGHSKKVIENATGYSVNMFAYPNGLPGDYNETTLQLLTQYGYSYAFLNYGGPTKLKDNFNLLEIGRITECNNGIVNFGWKVAGLGR